MNRTECQSCHRPIPRGSAVLRGDLRVVRAWHRDCYTVHRAVKDVPVPEVLSGTLMERLARMATTVSA